MTRILVVEADGLAAGALTAAGFEVVATAPSTEAAAALVRELTPDLVVVDAALDVNGIQAAPGGAPAVPIVYRAEPGGALASRVTTMTEPHGWLVTPWTEAQLRGVIAVALARHGAEARLRQRVGVLEDELKALTYSIAHDLRAPLRRLDGFSQALIDDHAASLAADAIDLLQRVRAGAQDMGRLIDGLLRLSRVIASEPRRGRVDLSLLARIAALELQSAQPERTVEIVIASDVVVDGDEDMLRSAIECLIGNAWKFSAKNPQARIELGVVDNGGQRVFFVRDNGSGFDARYTDKLFKPFQRLHAGSEFEGVGLGLALVKRVIARHGGRVWAESVVGQGATFYVAV